MVQKEVKNEALNSTNESENNPGDISKFKISTGIKQKLESRGITSLFPIQYNTFNYIYEGKDVIGQARTGTGKTFAFGLPVLSKLDKKSNNLEKGRKPRVLVMGPTRELVSQIASEFESVMNENLSILSIYGGVPYDKQINQLKFGVDIIVGTPGRMQDLIDSNSLDLSKIKYVILDEVDRMLDMGFQANVEKILEGVYSGSKKPQTLLFSATMPSWIQKIVKKYLNDNAEHVMLIDNNESQAANTVEHLAIQCPWRERSGTISDIMRVYGGNTDESRTIIFCERKKDCDELATHESMPNDCHVLHGDVPQDKRELVLKKYRDGKYTTLITTNVAARGLDIPNVDLVIQCHPPTDVEDYIHRSGRTGRAGKSGICILFYEPKEKDALLRVEKIAKFQFKRISAPSTKDIVDANLEETLSNFRKIPESASKIFQKSAEKLIEEFGAHTALAMALAQMSGKVEEVKPRSILSAKEGFTAFLFTANVEIKAKSYLYNNLKRSIDENIVENISSVQFTKDKKGIVFDLPIEHENEVIKCWKDSNWTQLQKITELPELLEQYNDNRGGRASNNNNRSFGRRNGENGFKRKMGGFSDFKSKMRKF